MEDVAPGVMRDKVKQERKSAAQHDGRRQHISQGGNSNDKYRHASDSENQARGAAANPNTCHVNFSACSFVFHNAPAGLKLPRIQRGELWRYH
jgi:hypothetical protein